MAASDTTQRIQAELLRQLRTQDIGDVKVTQLTEAVGINRVTFYRYYDSVYSVLQEMEDEFFTGFKKLGEMSSAVPFVDRYFTEPNPFYVACLEYLLRHRDLILALFGPYGDAQFQRRCEVLLETYLIEPALSGGYISEFSDEVRTFFASGFASLTVRWLRDDQRLSPERFAILMYRMLFGYYRAGGSI